MNRSHAAQPASSQAPAVQRKPAKGGDDAGIQRQAAKMPPMGDSQEMEQKLLEAEKAGFKPGSKAKPGEPQGGKIAAPAAEPKRTQAQVKADKGAGSQSAAEKKSKEIADQQVKAGAGEHEKKGGSAKPVDAKGQAPPSAKGPAPAAAATGKANQAADKANQAKVAGAKESKQAVDSVKNAAQGGAKAPADAAAKGSKGAEAAKAGAAADKAGAAAAGAEGKGKADGKDKAGAESKGAPAADKKSGPAGAAGKDSKGGAAAAQEIGKTPGAAPDAGVRGAVEKATGQDLSDVRVHAGAEAQAAAQSIGAEAFTVGSDIGMGKGAGPETLAHELAHTAQNKAAGGSAAPKGSISKPGDAGEKNADAVAKAATAGGGGAAPADREFKTAGPAPQAQDAKSAGPAPQIQRLAKPGADVQRETPPAGGSAATPEKKEPVKFTVRFANTSKTMTIPAGKKGQFSQKIDGVPGFKGGKAVLTLDGQGKPTGGTLNGQVDVPGVSGSLSFTIDASGNVSGSSPVSVKLDGIGTISDVQLSVAGGGLTGNKNIAASDVQAGKDCKVASGSGAVTVNGTMQTVRANFSGDADFAGGKLKGPITLNHASGATTGSAAADVKIESWEKSWNNGVKNMPAQPKFPLKYADKKWSGDFTAPYADQCPGSQGSSTVAMKYEDGKFSGSGDGDFQTLNGLIKGKTSCKVGADGEVEGTFSLETPTFKVGPLEGSAKVAGGIKKGEINATATGTLTGFDGKATGTFTSDIIKSGGTKWHGDVSLKIPKMKTAKVGIDWEIGKGFSGKGEIEPDMKAVEGKLAVDFSNKGFTADGAFKINLPLVKGAELKAKYVEGKITGQAKIDVGAIKIPQVAIESSSITAAFDGENFSLGGAAAISMAGGKVKGTLNANYDQAKGMTASADSTVSIPGINPVQLKLELQGEKLSGEAKTTVSIPYAKSAELTVSYKDGKFGGAADVDFDIPFLKKVVGKVELTPEGKVNGSLAITGQDINISPLTVESPTLKGEITDGKLTISGGGTVKGIPGCENAKLEMSMTQDQKFSGKIDAQLKIPGLKETKVALELKDGKISGSASVAAEFKGASGAIKVDYKDGKWSGTGTLGYKKGKFDGKIEAKLSDAGKLSGKGTVTYTITDNFKVTAELELREDATMKIGGKIQCPNKISLFKKEYRKELFKFMGRFGIPGLSIQVPVVGVVGLEVQLGGSADIFAGMEISLNNVTAAGSFDTATDDVQLQIGGALQGRAWAGVGVDLRAAAGLGIGPAFIGGYLNARGEGKIEAQITGSVNAAYSSASQALTLDLGVNASAGLSLSLTVSAGFTASIDLYVKTLKKDFPFGSKTFKYEPGISYNYNPQFKYTFGKTPSDSDIAPKNPPKLDGGSLAKGAGSAIA